MSIIPNPEERFWRTGGKGGRGVLALVSNSVLEPSEFDPLLGTMETSTLAETIVDDHNQLLLTFGPKYRKRLEAL